MPQAGDNLGVGDIAFEINGIPQHDGSFDTLNQGLFGVGEVMFQEVEHSLSTPGEDGLFYEVFVFFFIFHVAKVMVCFNMQS